ncbi:MAG: DHH family phosphoesterase [Deltaproteobacteria bacterium]|nr:DHH family phosphoesterase [Deltaproteobacteria bacterium]MBW1876553.1 DHH family phosphoesterase [Deltaproteobacteria bacterium]MBW2214515.1 DHH family phosphoesterase [Deltaproteobacteria bacterium]MBW2380237.1 DHH family phosphoesterase [Deltaproteobacteria bacterium]MBW2686126.1 DHH family phosphoesterase [Deltaproteobacteria bacterium]
MAYIDVFNGDADGICALTQLRNAEPRESTLVTGVKRDIALVAKTNVAAGDQITVLDLSFDKNRDGVLKALEAGAEIFYVDHHFAGEIPDSDRLTTIIDTDSNVCTSLLVNGHLGAKHVEWAVTGAFGDNLKASARTIAAPLSLSEEQLTFLENLGVYMNYNGYGSSFEDLHFPPAELFELVRPYATPFAFVEEAPETFEKLESGYQQDMASAAAVKPLRESEKTAVFMLPNETWARRVSGVYSNDLANASPARAHAVLTERPDGTYLVSVRAPLENKQGADELCRQFPTGGGRAAAAGINALPGDQLDAFIDALAASYA